MHLTLINQHTNVVEVQERLKERFGIEAHINDVEDVFISLIADNEEMDNVAYYKYLEMK